MDNAKANAVLEAAEQAFCEMEVQNHPPVVGNGPQVIAGRLGLSPAEVVVHLRMLHREGRIGLLNGIGANVTIARRQDLLQAPTTVVTGGGKSIRLAKGRRPRPPEDEMLSEDAEAPDVSKLLSRITQLERELSAARAAAEKAETRRRNMSNARQQSEEAKAGVEEELRRVKAENRSLTKANKTLQTEADKVPGLERQIAELKRPPALPNDLAATIARLTGT